MRLKLGRQFAQVTRRFRLYFFRTKAGILIDVRVLDERMGDSTNGSFKLLNRIDYKLDDELTDHKRDDAGHHRPEDC